MRRLTTPLCTQGVHVSATARLQQRLCINMHACMGIQCVSADADFFFKSKSSWHTLRQGDFLDRVHMPRLLLPRLLVSGRSCARF